MRLFLADGGVEVGDFSFGVDGEVPFVFEGGDDLVDFWVENLFWLGVVLDVGAKPRPGGGAVFRVVSQIFGEGGGDLLVGFDCFRGE